MSFRIGRRQWIQALAAWWLGSVLIVACAGATAQPAPAEVDERAASPTIGDSQPTVPDAIAEAPPQPHADSGAILESVGALSQVRMVASPDPKAEAVQQYAAGSDIWIAFYALGKAAGGSDAYSLRVVDYAGATVTEVPLYGPDHTVPDDSQSSSGTGGLVVHVAVPVFADRETPPVAAYRSLVLLNDSSQAELAWSVAP